MDKETIFDQIYGSIIEGDLTGTRTHVQAALDAQLPPGEILNEAMIAAMSEVGRMFEEMEIFVPEMLVSARAMQGGLDILRPLLAEADVQPVGKVVLGTVQGDMHDIGKNLVGMMLEGAGFDVVDLGVDVPADKFVAAIEAHQPMFVGMSALLTTTMPNITATIEAIKQAGLRDKTRIMVGGAPVTEEFAQAVGADMFAPDASSAASRSRRMAISS